MNIRSLTVIIGMLSCLSIFSQSAKANGFDVISKEAAKPISQALIADLLRNPSKQWKCVTSKGAVRPGVYFDAFISAGPNLDNVYRSPIYSIDPSIPNEIKTFVKMLDDGCAPRVGCEITSTFTLTNDLTSIAGMHVELTEDHTPISKPQNVFKTTVYEADCVKQ